MHGCTLRCTGCSCLGCSLGQQESSVSFSLFLCKMIFITYLAVLFRKYNEIVNRETILSIDAAGRGVGGKQRGRLGAEHVPQHMARPLGRPVQLCNSKSHCQCMGSGHHAPGSLLSFFFFK